MAQRLKPPRPATRRMMEALTGRVSRTRDDPVFTGKPVRATPRQPKVRGETTPRPRPKAWMMLGIAVVAFVGCIYWIGFLFGSAVDLSAVELGMTRAEVKEAVGRSPNSTQSRVTAERIGDYVFPEHGSIYWYYGRTQLVFSKSAYESHYRLDSVNAY